MTRDDTAPHAGIATGPAWQARRARLPFGSHRMFGLADIISPLDLDTFMRDYAYKRAVHVPGPPEKFQHMFGWKEVTDHINTCRPSFEGVKLVHDKKPLPPAEIARMGHWLSQGATLVINHVQHVDPITETLADNLSREFNSLVNINCYVSFPSRQGFDCHYDTHDVWIVHTAGAKEWKVFEPTRQFPLDKDPSEEKSKHTRPTEGEYLHCTLTPGDMLYIPRGHWHYALSSEPCIHLTVSHNNRSGIDFLTFLLNEWREREGFLREDFPVYQLDALGGGRSSEAFDAHLARFREYVVEAIQRDEVRERALHWTLVETPARAKFTLPELAQLDRHPITPDTLFELQPPQKVVPYVALNGQIQLLARGHVVQLDQVPRAIVEVIVGGQPFKGAQLLAAAPDVRWEQAHMLVQQLLVANLLMLSVPASE